MISDDLDGERARLSDLMAAAARDLRRQPDAQHTYRSAVSLAVNDVAGCRAAGLSIVSKRRHIETATASDEAVGLADQLQYECGEGPCLDVIWTQHTVYTPSLGHDSRWPTWGPATLDRTPFRSVLSFQLFTADDNLGALNLYSDVEDGFDQDDQIDGLALAAHIAIAVAAAQKIENLDRALHTRTVIGQATGILMERYGLTPQVAFAVLVRTASATETKVRDVAHALVTSRELPGT